VSTTNYRKNPEKVAELTPDQLDRLETAGYGQFRSLFTTEVTP
jgi:hypothetical protein